MFPIRDRRGRVIAFGGRVLDKQEPKYLNSPETTLFHKGQELYGLYEARKAGQDANMIIVVEGYMDVVALAQKGIENAVATLGTAANQQHSELLFKVVPNIAFCFDGDRAGRAAAWRALCATLPCLQDGRDAHFLFLPDGEDPDSVVNSQGAAGFNDLLATRIPIIDYLYQHLSTDIDMHSIGGKAQLAEKAKPLLATIPKGIYKQLALRRLESLVGVSLGSDNAAPRTQNTRPPRAKSDEGLTAMSRAVLLCLQYPAVVHTVAADDYDISAELPGADILSELPGADILLKLIAYSDSTPDITTARLLERFRDSQSYSYEAEFQYSIDRLKQRSRQTLTDKINQSERTGLLGLKRR